MVSQAFAARALVALAVVPAAAGGLSAWHLAGCFSPSDASWLSGVLPGLLVLVLGVGTAFAPWDRPTAAWMWAAPLSGLGTGTALAGLLVFPHSFVALAGLLLGWAWSLRAAAELLAPGEDEHAALERRRLGRRLLHLLGAAGGVVLVLLWRPAESGAHPTPLETTPAPVVSRPPDVRREGRVRRDEELLIVKGEDVYLQLHLDRPQIDLELGGASARLEPCLYVERGASDEFFSLPWLNGFSAEPRGLARCEWIEGERRAWVRAEWPRGRAFGAPSLGSGFLGWGRHMEGALSAWIELEVDLVGLKLVRVDAGTRLARPLSVHRATLGWLQLKASGPPRLRWGLQEGFTAVPPRQEEGAPAELLVREDQVVRALRARRGQAGPWEILEQGTFEDWVQYEDDEARLAVVFPDWAAQAGTLPSASAGHGLPANALHYWSVADRVNLLLDVGSSRVGPGPRATTLPPGIYRDRFSFIGLPEGEGGRGRALRERERLTQGF